MTEYKDWVCRFYASADRQDETLNELIRCKDCKKNGSTLCPMLFIEMKDTDYCSYAERKDSDAV